MRKILLLLVFLSPFLYCPPACANNIVISNASLQEQDTTAHTRKIQFDISWANSWRDTVNYDAAWVFIKYSTDGGTTWSHAWLSTTAGDHTIPTNFECKVGPTTISSTARGMGVFLQRDSGNTGGGNVTLSGVKLKWNYGDQSPSVTDVNAALALVRIMAIEMVYVPTYDFSVGDGSAVTGKFYTYPTDTTPYVVSSEDAITVGTVNGNLYYSGGGYGNHDNVPAAFPKGHDAFYLMKYECSQGQYADFLNTLTRTQQGARVAATISGDTVTKAYVMPNKDILNQTDRVVITCPASGNGTTAPITFYVLPISATDKRDDRALGWVEWQDLVAYADWAGLRPFTELEFEKACRGPSTPVANEYPWGSTSYTNADAISGTENGTETVTTTNANVNCNSVAYAAPPATDNFAGPIRCGIFAKSGSTRQAAGASYYGVMELGGGGREHVVSVCEASVMAFTGLPGDGALDSSGNANVTYWPLTYGGLRAASWSATAVDIMQTSDRTDAINANNTRAATYVIRVARTAP